MTIAIRTKERGLLGRLGWLRGWFRLRGWTTAVLVAALVAALTLTGAVPVQAGDREKDLAKAIAAAVVLGLIVKNIDKNRRPDPQPVPQPVRQPRVPRVCAIDIDGDERSVTVYPESCLRAEGFHYRLPANCARSARVFGRPDRVFGVQCLRNAGFRVSGN